MWGLSSPPRDQTYSGSTELSESLDRQGNPIELFLITSFNIYWCGIIPKKGIW